MKRKRKKKGKQTTTGGAVNELGEERSLLFLSNTSVLLPSTHFDTEKITGNTNETIPGLLPFGVLEKVRSCLHHPEEGQLCIGETWRSWRFRNTLHRFGFRIFLSFFRFLESRDGWMNG